MKERNETLDILKGVAILAVLFGHALQRGLVSNYENTIGWKVIYSFHMPLFILLSGFTLYLSKPKYNMGWLRKKFSRLMIPLISWTIIVELMCNFEFTGLKPFTKFPETLYEFINYTISHPDWAFWFLWVILACMLIFYIFNSTLGKNKILKKLQIVYLILIGIILFKLPNQRYLGLSSISYYFPIFVCGYYISKYRMHISQYSKYAFLPSAVVWISYANSWNFWNSIASKYVIAVAAMISIYCIVSVFENYLKWLTYFGKRSLELYVCESIFLNIGISNGYIRVISIFITVTCLSLLTAKILKTNRYINLIAFGSHGRENFFSIKEESTASQ